MADICKCKGETCPYRGSCYRYMAIASECQSYLVEDDCKKKDYKFRIEYNILNNFNP